MLIKTIQQSIELIQMARSASATPALGYVSYCFLLFPIVPYCSPSSHIVFYLIIRPHPVDIPAEMEEIHKRLQAVASGSPRLRSRPSPIPLVASSIPVLPVSPQLHPQDMIAEVGKVHEWSVESVICFSLLLN